MTQDKTHNVVSQGASASPTQYASLRIPAAGWPPKKNTHNAMQPLPRPVFIFAGASADDAPHDQPIGFDGQAGTAPVRVAQGADSAPPAGLSRPVKPAPAASAQAISAQGKVSRAENAFTMMSYLALPFLAILLFLQTGAGLIFPSVYFPDEVTVATTYAALTKSGQWLLPPPHESFFMALPGQYWFTHLIKRIPGVELGFFLPLVACLSAFLTLAATYTLGMCAGLGRRISFAGGLILLSCAAFVPLTHYVGPDMLLAGLLAFSLACLCRGFMQERAYVWLSLGFVLAGAATLVGGIIALWLPVLGSLLFVIWRGTLRRAHGLDAALGFGLLLLCLCGWMGAVILWGGESAQGLAPLTKQFFAPFTQALWPQGDAWWQSAAVLAMGLLPWMLVPLFVAWGRVLGGAWTSIVASRKESSGIAWLWICLALGLILCIFMGKNPFFAIIPLLPIAALVLAKALLGFTAGRSRLYFTFIAALFVLGGAGLAALTLPAVATQVRDVLSACFSTNVLDAVLGVKGLPILGGISVLSGIVLYRFTDRSYPAGALTICVLCVIVIMQPATLISGPSLKGRIAVELPAGMGMGLGVEAQPAPKAAPAVIESPTPAQEAKPAEVEAPTPVEEAKPAEAEAPAPAEETKPAEAEAPAPVEETKPAEAETPAPVEETKPAEAETPAPAAE